VEAVAQSERLFAAELVPSGSGDPRSTATERPPSSRPEDSQICLACQAHLGSRVAANPVVEVGEEGCMAMHRDEDGGSGRLFNGRIPHPPSVAPVAGGWGNPIHDVYIALGL
jgi:hypothetical protein